MSSPEDQTPPGGGSCTLPPPGWTCARGNGHDGPCAATPELKLEEAPRGYVYQITERDEFDLDLPGGNRVRCRKLDESDVYELSLLEMLDGFTGKLTGDEPKADETNSAIMSMVSDPVKNRKLFGPIDRAVVATVICPKVVDAGETNDDQINVKDIKARDRMLIFNAVSKDLFAAMEAQLTSLKSL